MKAINCSQCSALVGQISSPDRLAFCNYCGAKIFFQNDENKPASSAPEFKLIDKEGFSERIVDILGVESDDEELGEWTKRFLIILMIGSIIFLPFLFANEFKKKDEISRNQKNTSAVSNSSTTSDQTGVIPASVPNLSYRASVEYSKTLDAISVATPIINLEKLSTDDIKELKDKGFENRKIRVFLEINEDGNVVSAKALNGHPILRESSVEAAKKSLFSARKIQTSAFITYIYTIN